MLSHTCLAPVWAAGSPVQYQCRSAPPEPQPRRSYSVTVVLRISEPSGRVTHSWLRRIGNCQQTSGFIVTGGKTGAVQEDACLLVFAGPVLGLAIMLVEFQVTLAAQTLLAELPIVVG